MSESNSEAGTQQEEAKGPQSAGEAAKEIFVRILAGLGAVGRGLRGGFVSTYTCVQRTVYPVKETCVHGFDTVQSYFNPATATARGGGAVAPAEVVRFTGMEGELETEPDSSERS